MAYYQYDIEVNQELYAKYEEQRKVWQHSDFTLKDIIEVFEDIGIPLKSPKLLSLCFKYELLLKKGRNKYCRYFFPKDTVPYSRFEGVEKEFYNGTLSLKKQPKPKDKELGRVPITEEYCIDFLKRTGKYIIFEVNPNVDKLKDIVNPKLLLEISEARLK